MEIIKKLIKIKPLFFCEKSKPSKELSEAINELKFIEKHPEQYKVYHNVDELFTDILAKE